MDNRFKYVITTINTRSDASLSVYDAYKMESLYQFYPATRILNDYGSAENFFTQLKIKGYTSLSLVYHLKNQSGRIKTKKGLDVNLANELTEIKRPTLSFAVQEKAAPKAINKVPVPPKQDTFFNSFGLIASQTAELLGKKKQNDHLKDENFQLTSKNDTLNEQILNYKKEILKQEYDFKREIDKLRRQQLLINQISPGLPFIINLLNPSSNQVTNLNYGSEVKNKFAKVLAQIDDDSILFLLTILKNKKTNSRFSMELNVLMEKYNLWR